MNLITKQLLSISAFLALAYLLNTAKADEYTFTNGVIFAKIIGPNKSTKETADKNISGPGQLHYFWTTIEIVSTKNEFARELKGQKVKLLTGEFEKNLLREPHPLVLTRRTDKDGKTDYWLLCTSVTISKLVAESDIKGKK